MRFVLSVLLCLISIIAWAQPAEVPSVQNTPDLKPEKPLTQKPGINPPGAAAELPYPSEECHVPANMTGKHYSTLPPWPYIRIIRPGMATTTEYNRLRLSVWVDEDDLILTMSCG